MNREIPEPLPPLTARQRAFVARLSDAEIKAIDAVLLANASAHWSKVAAIIGTAMRALEPRYHKTPEAFYVQRITRLVQTGCLEAQGDLSYPRFSEVRLPR